MKLKKIFGKTLKVAKKSARQIYGPEVSNFGEILEQQGNKSTDEDQKEGKRQKKEDTPGVRFERSDESKSHGVPQKNIEKNLESIREYAYQQLTSDIPIKHTTEKTIGDEPDKKVDKPLIEATKEPVEKQAKKNSQVYSRNSIRPSKKKAREEDSLSDESKKTDSGLSADPVVQQELNRLHDRLDKLEQLIKSSNTEPEQLQTSEPKTEPSYESHPDFHNFLQAGIDKEIITTWFDRIANQGIDPFINQKDFRAELSSIIRNTLAKPAPDYTEKHVLFTGLPGAGKTHMIMKLSKHPYFMQKKNISIATILPRGTDEFYTILEPFCRNNDLPYDEITNRAQLFSLMDTWQEYDHVLIDSPAFPADGKIAINRYHRIRNLLQPLHSLEIHYLVNASHNDISEKGLFANPKGVDIDYLAITHLDTTTNWGSIISLLMQTGSPLRYISVGNTVPDSLSRFNPKWFTQKMLQNIWNNNR